MGKRRNAKGRVAKTKGKGIVSTAWTVAKNLPKIYGAYRAGKAGFNAVQKVGNIVSRIKNVGRKPGTPTTSTKDYVKLPQDIHAMFKPPPEYKPITKTGLPGTYDKLKRAAHRYFIGDHKPIATPEALQMDSLQGSKMSERGRLQRVEAPPDAGIDHNSLIAKAADKLNNAAKYSKFSADEARAKIAADPFYEAPDIWHDAEGRRKRRGGKRPPKGVVPPHLRAFLFKKKTK